MCAARKRDAAKLSSLGCQRNDGEAKQAFVRRWGGGGVGDGSGHFLVALHWEVGGGGYVRGYVSELQVDRGLTKSSEH